MFKDQNGRGNPLDGDSAVKWILTAVSFAAVLVLFFILLFIIGNSTDALGDIGIWSFITNDIWRPSSGEYGAAAIITGTLLVTAGAILFSVPIGVAVALFMSEVSDSRIRRIMKPAVELFAGIPSVVYGFFGLMVMVPFLSDYFGGQTPTGFSWIAGSLLLGIMALPTIVSVSEDALRAVPRAYREASLAMGATRWETTSKVVIPAAVSGIASAAILGIGRAVGETMAVMMVTGNANIVPDPIWNVFSYLRTITATLALEMPEVVVGSTHYSALFLLALILMVIVLAVNLVARAVVKRIEMKFRGEAKDRALKLTLGKKGSKKFKLAIKVAVLVLFLYMALSLFVSDSLAVFGAAVLAAAILGFALFVKRLPRMTIQKLANACLLASALFCVAILVIILGDIIINAVPSLNWNFITEYPSSGGRSGGIWPAIEGTLKLIAGTALIALPLGILSGVYLTEYAKKGKLTAVMGQAIDVLNGTPSIVFGLFGMSALVVFCDFGISLTAGCFTLAFMIMPVIIRTTEEAIHNVPREIREASYAMGANKWQTTFKVVVPAALGGIMTGSILGLGRAAGETAPIMFTAAIVMQYSPNGSFLDPVMALPYHLYYLSTEGMADPSLQYATAFVLLVIVLAMFLAANVIREYSNKKNNW